MKKQVWLLALMVGGFMCARTGQANGHGTDATSSRSTARAVAVLDFRELGPSVELEPLRMALPRMLTTDLSAYAGIEVVARERIDRMIKETHLGESGLIESDTAQKAGRALAADYLVQGTFSGSADGIKAHVELFDVAAGQVIASADLSGKPEEALAIEAKLLAAVTKALKLEAPKAAPAPQPRTKPVTLAVLYLQNLSPDAKLDPMEIGFADLLITYLQDRQGIAVVEREQLNKVLEELGLQKSALADSAPQPKIGQMLGAQVMLLGSFVVVKDAIRFDAHLVAVDTGIMLQAVYAQGSANDLEPVLQTLAERVTNALAAQPRSKPLPEHRGKTSLEAMLHYSRGMALYDANQQQALEEFERCVYLDPDNIGALFRLGWIYEGRIHDYRKAAEAYARIIALRPDYITRCYDRLSHCYSHLGMPEQELAVLERAWEQLKDNESSHQYPDVIGYLARVNERLNRLQETKRWYQLGVEKAKTSRDRVGLRDDLAHTLSWHGDKEGAIIQLEAIVEEAPRDDPTCTLCNLGVIESLGKRYQQTKDYSRAKRVFEPVIRDSKIARDAAMAQYHLAKVAISAGQERDAVELFVQMADRFPLLYEAEGALFQAASLLESSLNEPQRAAQLYREIGLRYGGYGLQLSRELRRKLGPPFEEHKPRPILTTLLGPRAWQAELLKSGRWLHPYSRSISSRLPNRMIVAGYSVLMINYSQASYFTTEELETLRSFVNAGGGLFLNVSGRDEPLDWQSCVNLLSALGVSTSSDAPGIRDTSTIVLNPKHNILNIEEAPYFCERSWSGSSVGGSFGRSFSVPQEMVVATCQDRPVIAAFGYGLGRVILSGLGGGLTDMLDNDKKAPAELVNARRVNRAFLRTAVQWLQGTDDRSQLKSSFEAAERKLAADNLGGAIADLRSIISRYAGTRWADEARLLIADILRLENNRSAAAAEYHELVTSAKESQMRTLARLNLARIRAAGGGPGAKQARAECWKIWGGDQSSPWAAAALYDGGRWAFEAGDFKAAQACFDKVMNTCGYGYEKLFAMLWSARCRETLGDDAGALRIYRTIIDEYRHSSVPLPWGDQNGFATSYIARRIKELAP